MAISVRRILVIFLVLLLSLSFLYVLSDTRSGDVFTGVCVYSTSSFSVLSNGSWSVGVSRKLTPGRVYRIEGRFYDGKRRMKVSRAVPSKPEFPLNHIEGYYWRSRGCYILSPRKTALGVCLNVTRGTKISAYGVFSSGKFYPVRYTRLPSGNGPMDGIPWKVEGVILSAGSRPVLWNGTDEVVLYVPYGVHLRPGERVRVEGIARYYSRLSLLVDSPSAIRVLGMAGRADIGNASIGQIAVGRCMVVKEGRSLKLNCTKKRLYGINARVGDVVAVKAVVRKASLYCVSCRVVSPREKLPNSICRPKVGVIRVSGRVEWVKTYSTGFGLANLTNGRCWVLLKLRSSLGVSLARGQEVTAYGLYTLYRGMPALNIGSGEDVCSGNC